MLRTGLWIDSNRARTRLVWLAVVVAYLAVALLWMLPVSLDLTARVANPGDPLHLGWLLAWDAHQIVRAPWSLFDSNSFYPYPRSLTFADHLLPEALMVAPLFWLSGNAVLGVNVAVLLGLVLSALAMFALVRELTQSRGAAFVSGAIYAFNGFTQAELPRVQVLHVEWWPLALLFLVRFARDGRWRNALLFGMALALQGLSGTYYLVYSALLVPLWLAAVAYARRRGLDRREWARLAGVGLAMALPLLVVLWPYVVTYRTIGYAKEWTDGVDLLGLLDVRHSWLWGRWLGPAPKAAPQFVGLLGLAALVLGLRWKVARRADNGTRLVLALALVPLVVGLVLSWGTTLRLAGSEIGPGPAALLVRVLPPLRGMAGSERAGVLLRLGTALVIGSAVARWLQRLRSRRGALLAASAAAALLVLEQWSWPTPATTVPVGAQVPAVYRVLAETPRLPVAEVPPHRGTDQKLWAAYLYFSTYHWRPVPIGRTSFYPPAHNWLVWTLRGFPDERSLDILDRLGVHTVVVHPLAWRNPRERRARMAVLDASPRLGLVRRFEDGHATAFTDVFQLGGERIYEVLPAPQTRYEPLCEPLERVGGRRWRVRATETTAPRSLRDGDPRTGWIVREEGRRTLKVRLTAPETVAAITIDVAYPWGALPPGVDVEAKSMPKGGWERVAYEDGAQARWEVIEAQIRTPHRVRWTLRFPPRRISSLRLTAGSEGTDGPYGMWSVGELGLYRRCEVRGRGLSAAREGGR